MAFLELLVQSLFMGVGTYLVGSIPVSLSKQRSSAITSHSAALSIFSVGLLISTALAVIIPEGVSVLSRSIQSGKEGEREGEVHEHLDSDAEVGGWIGAALVAGFVLMFCVHQFAGSHAHAHNHSSAPQSGLRRHANDNKDVEQAVAAPTGEALSSEAQDLRGDASSGGGGNISGASPETTSPRRSADYFSASSPIAVSVSERAGAVTALAIDPLNSASPAFSTFIGLVVHALADGISLGAASMANIQLPGNNTGDSAGLGFLIFISLIVHKAPVAFSLSTLLLSHSHGLASRLQYSQIKRSLIVFSLATPLGALVTWLLLRIITLASWSDSMDESTEEDGNIDAVLGGSLRGRMEFWTGMALLFSAGTFLFVSTHVMADIEASNQSAVHLPITSGEEAWSLRANQRRTKIGLFLAGMATPLLMTIILGGHHGH
ncbi:MAG: hypothetical protein CYPHOPRED_005878 [Cyphobasidiales sp. Tagirdzhanova-0007]|nr:MAG: hypothetical protein CYPHOPRED_005878 [Cyphobasidiales sp. Tagirdzhanova-0007]